MLSLCLAIGGCSGSYQVRRAPRVPPVAKGVRTVGTFQLYHVGDAIDVGGEVSLCIHAVMDPYVANTQTQLQIYRPRAGWKLIGLDVELSNQGSKAQRFYAMLGLNLRGTLKDPEGRPREFHSEPWFTTKAPDGLIGPNSSMRGWAVFQVPD